MEDILEKKQKMQNMIIKEFNEKDKNKEEKIEKEKEQLVENVQMLANELDEINEDNKVFLFSLGLYIFVLWSFPISFSFVSSLS